jgi:hypothetical protein
MSEEFKESNDLFAEIEQKAREATTLDNSRRMAEGKKPDTDHYPYMSGALQAAYSKLYSAYKLTLDKLNREMAENKRLKERLENVREDDSAED